MGQERKKLGYGFRNCLRHSFNSRLANKLKNIYVCLFVIILIFNLFGEVFKITPKQMTKG